MNKEILEKLINVASDLDARGLTKEADALDRLIKHAFMSAHEQAKRDELDDYFVLDYKFEYDEDGNTIDVDSINFGARKSYEPSPRNPTQISLTWECGAWRIMRPILNLPAGRRLDNHYITAIWKLDEDGYIVDEDGMTGEAHAC
jgi:hypothetical protein